MTQDSVKPISDEERRLIYLPGVWRCAKCEFELIQSVLNVNTGAVHANDKPGQKCPNCNSPLWRVTYRDAYMDCMKRLEQLFDERSAAITERDAALERAERAEKALGPFAKEANNIEGASRIELHIHSHFGGCKISISLAQEDFRRARNIVEGRMLDPQPEIRMIRGACRCCGARTEKEAETRCRPTSDETGERACPGDPSDNEGFILIPDPESLREFYAWLDRNVA